MKYLALLALCAATTVQAQNKCTAPDGSVSFQQAPCAAGEKREALTLAATPPSQERPEHVRRALANRRIVIGMNKAEVRQLLGTGPERVNVSVVAGMRSEQAVYEAHGVRWYLYFNDRDEITSYQRSE